MKNQPQSYSSAIAEIEKILTRFSAGELDVDTLAAEVARATELIGWCRRRLAKAEQDVAEVLDDKKSPDNLQTRDTPQTPGAPQAPDNLQIPDDSKSSNTPQTPDTPKTQNNQ